MEYLTFEIDPCEPVYIISVVSKLVNLPEWTLRQLDKDGLVCPKRSQGKTRLYCKKDVMTLLHIRGLIKEYGVNTRGIKYILRLEKTPLEKEGFTP
ncbi:MAG: MerR family transcriptional regulator [Candidatus Omnitrophica bacterium]|nr:MerR family transcriptional regulator [Candidatus Omnitrophota bacterium]